MDKGSTPGLGPFAVCHSPSLSLPLFPVISPAVLSIKAKKIFKKNVGHPQNISGALQQNSVAALP